MPARSDGGGLPLVVGVDGSEASAQAITWAAPEAVRGGYLLRLVHVRTGAGTATDGLLAESAEVARAAAPTVRVETAVRDPSTVAPRGRASGEGGVVATLVAESLDAVYLVVGARGTTGFAGLLLGSAALQLAQYARCPVVVARPTASERPTGRIVVGVDASDAAATALRAALREADLRGADLLVLHAVKGGPDEPADTEQTIGDVVTRTAAGLRADGQPPDVHVQIEVVDEHPAAALIEASDHADLVVVGWRGVGGFRGMLLGSVAQAVLEHARSPVAIVRRRRVRLA